ncbi:phosphotransferase [Microlunatus ginsengisoli]|uniref:Aminoglycoside phosphotransferase domain-containing protein n=1 Tax=Microlunatus ginsengisoli TaxID=363863 RepID=A0ABP7AYA7_9ACTN
MPLVPAETRCQRAIHRWAPAGVARSASVCESTTDEPEKTIRKGVAYGDSGVRWTGGFWPLVPAGLGHLLTDLRNVVLGAALSRPATSDPVSRDRFDRMITSNTDSTADLIQDLLREQHPDLAELPIREVDGGWGNQMWRLGDDLAVRIQRMDTDPAQLLKEGRWLPLLAPCLPLPIPVPVRYGTPSPRCPKWWTVVTWVPGLPLDHASITRGEDAADTLATFLKALHVVAPADGPVDTTGHGAHPRDSRGGFAHFLASLDTDTIGANAADIRAVWDDAAAAPAWHGPPVWVHGDLHPANVVTANGTLAGVIDFGALFIGDPAADLAAAWVVLPEGAAARFLTSYPDLDEATFRRARGHAVLKSLFLLLMGQNGDRGLPGGKPAWGPAGRAALHRVLDAC